MPQKDPMFDMATMTAYKDENLMPARKSVAYFAEVTTPGENGKGPKKTLYRIRK